MLCALMLLGVAFLFVAHVAFYEWFYWTCRWAYRYTLASRTIDWIGSLILLALTVWMVRTALSLLRGRSNREDQGLLAPRSLRIWGVVFAVVPILMVLVAPKVLAHFHLLLGFWTAAGACFLLAAKRSQAPSAATVAIAAPQGPPPPIE